MNLEYNFVEKLEGSILHKRNFICLLFYFVFSGAREKGPEDPITWVVASFLSLTTHVATSVCQGSMGASSKSLGVYSHLWRHLLVSTMSQGENNWPGNRCAGQESYMEDSPWGTNRRPVDQRLCRSRHRQALQMGAG